MITIFGIPGPLLFGQLLLGLINGAFYAMLSLGLAVIFGMLNIINFAHGSLFMMGAFASWMLLNYLGIGYFPSLILSPILVGIFGIILEKTIISRLYKLDHLYGLLLTFGLSLVIEGLFRNAYGSSGMPYRIPDILQGATNLGFMYMPNYRGWVVLAALVVCISTWAIIEKTSLGATLRAATENAPLVQAFGVDVPRLITLTYGGGVALAAFAGVLAAPIYSVNPNMGSNFHQHRVRRRRHRRHGLDHGLDPDRVRPRRDRGINKSVLPAGVRHRGVPGDGDRVAGQTPRPVWKGRLRCSDFRGHNPSPSW
jgi:branched-chain amino acid transport system permease protein